MRLPLTILSVPLLLLSATVTTIAALSLAAWMPPHVPTSIALTVSLVVALALHLAWILPAMERRFGILLAAGWLVATYLSAEGVVAAGLGADGAVPAMVLEGVILALALAHAPSTSWPDRLARWRRSRERISTELRIGEGLLPWAHETLSRIIHGRADRPRNCQFDQIIADLAASEDRMRRTIARLSLPEAVRQCLYTVAHTIAADAETTLARMSVELERRALDQAAECRDAILRLDDLPEAEKERLASECESLMLELTHDIGVVARPTAPLHPRGTS